ncbi:MAG: efflux RND transporter permease subunit, partial [Ignavibacteriae bacterium]|nr:efflux RND transporter permease subunit [Ignavibacteriota bacterium]
ITASTLTTIAVFVPVLFVPNITGQLFKDLVLTITFSLIVSLIVALTVVPLMSANILRLENKNKKEGRLDKIKNKITLAFDRLNANYANILNWSIYHRKTVLLIVSVLFIISIGLTTFLGGEFLPKSDQGFVDFLMESPSGTPIEKTRLYAYKIEDIVREIVPKDEMESIAIFYGEREGLGAFGTTSSTIEAIIKLKPKEQRKITQFELQDSLRKSLDDIPGVTYYFQEGGAFTTEKDIEVKIVGFDVEIAKSIANELKNKFEKVNGFVDITLNTKETTPELQIHLDKDIMNDLKLSGLSVASNISTAMAGKIISQYREKGDEYNIRIQYDKKFRNQKDMIEDMELPLLTGDMIKLKQIANVTEEEASPTIFRENQSRFVSVGISLSGIDLSKAVEEVNKIVAETAIPSDFQVIVGGTAEDQQEAFFYLSLAFIAAILLVYMIMAAQFESFVDPLIIMFTVPLSVIGVFIFLFITGTSISVMALVGLVMLVGIAVNNGIVLVDYTNQLRKQGKELFEAVKEACAARMRPVLMTALTTILGMVPLALELGSGAETWTPLARAVIGGLTTTTILTLVVIPILYIIFERLEEKIKTKWRDKKAT